MRKWLACLLILLAASLATLVFAQMRAASRRDTPAAEGLRAKRESAAADGERLRKLFAPAGVGVDEGAAPKTGDSFRGLKISWETPGRKNSSASATLRAGQLSLSVASSIISERRGKGALPRERALELSPEHVLLATVDADSKLRWWSVIPDPRVLRSEGPKAEGDGELTGVRIFRPDAEFFVNLPFDAEAAELRFYHPLEDGGEFRLQLLGAVALRRD